MPRHGGRTRASSQLANASRRARGLELGHAVRPTAGAPRGSLDATIGLYAEQTSVTGEALGNYPQALTHLALISAAYNLDRPLDGAR